MRISPWLLLLAALPGVPLSAQAAPDLWLRLDGRDSEALEVRGDHGYAAFDLSELVRLGWDVSRFRDTVTVAIDSSRVVMVVGTPFFRWNDDLLQMTDGPYVERGRVFAPAQFLIDFVPDRIPGFFWDPSTRTLNDGVVADVMAERPPRPPTEWGRASRVVVIDAGHGGIDPGAIGPSGIREKDVAIGLARALASALAADSTIEVLLTRDRDVRVPLWRRGEQATLWKGDRPGVFVSLHANALPQSRATRGFETYFLSEARTDHERRVAALENSADQQRMGPSPAPDELGAILGELRNHDYQHWSSHLAELIQVELAEVHPGPDRGVKQGPFAVITNALMPAVLIEIGYLTHRTEERLVGRPEFQEAAASAIARAIDAFFRQYPGGTGAVGPVGPQPE